MKNIVLFTSGLLSLFIFALDNITFGYCFYVKNMCQDISYILAHTFLIFPIIFIFSLVTYFLPPRVFAAWWVFAKYAIPIIFVISFGINAGWHHNPAGQWQDIFDLPALFVLYGIFIVGSLIQIARGWYSR